MASSSIRLSMMDSRLEKYGSDAIEYTTVGYLQA